MRTHLHAYKHPSQVAPFPVRDHCVGVHRYLRYSLSYQDLEEIMAERGLAVDHTTIFRWLQHYASELEKQCRPHLKDTNNSWRVNETYIKIRKTRMYLYKAVDSQANTQEFLLSPTQHPKAAKRFFLKALQSCTQSTSQTSSVRENKITPSASVALPVSQSVPHVINIDKNLAYPKAIADLKATGTSPQ